MHRTSATSLLLLNLATAAPAIVFPDSLKDLFTMTLEPNNTVIFTAIAPANNKTTPVLSQQDPPLPITWHLCTGQAIDIIDWESARSSFCAFCDAGGMIPRNGKVVFKVNHAVAYGCSAGGDNPCSTTELMWFTHWLDDKCGFGMAGMADMQDWAKRYGRGLAGDQVCRGVRGG
ncbi:hypothetical protein B0T16DRAFT_454815 [Cercophora newfieldiana]|uniref:Uncharacterized protein n=1 Tax=Cercophora newfieldiana TaxID=92897 RepID=A0AA39YHK5_9PEZI|nr:hypothetical protein B0T16DRAFT_454815 [Cercophora newfieldiana]